MPIALPPAQPPHFTDVDILEERHAVAQAQGEVPTIKVQVGSDTLLVDGNTYLAADRIHRAAALVKTPPQFIVLLDALYAAKGYQLVNVEYGRDPDTRIIYVRVNEGYLDAVNVPPLLQPFFDRFEGRHGLKRNDFEVMRVLATQKTERAGLAVSAAYHVSKTHPDAFTLKMQTKPKPGAHLWSGALVFGNPGNRFLGRYFGFANLQYHTDGGDLLGVNYGRAFTNLGDPRGGKNYNYGALSYSTINTTGSYGISASYTGYELKNRFGLQASERARIVKGNLEASQILHATGKNRWLLSERLEYIDATTEFTHAPVTTTLSDGTRFPVAGQNTQDERYADFRLGSTLIRSWHLFGHPGSVRVNGSYKRGFAGRVDNLVNANRSPDFNLFAGKFKLTYRLFLGVDSILALEGQRTLGDELPQQQQWVLGGPDRLSAFLPGILVGDNGAYGRFALRSPGLQLPGSTALRLSLYAEAGTAEFADRRGSTAATRAAADAGVKLEFAYSRWLSVTGYSAKSLGERNFEIYPGEDFVDDSTVDFFFNVKIKF